MWNPFYKLIEYGANIARPYKGGLSILYAPDFIASHLFF